MFEEFEVYIQDYADRYLTKSKGNIYICPYCKTAFTLIDMKRLRFDCFSCDKEADIYDLIGEVENIPDKKGQLERAKELYGNDDIVQPLKEKNMV